MFIVTFFATVGILLGFASLSSGLESGTLPLLMVTNVEFFRIIKYEDAVCTIPKTTILHPLNSYLGANVGEFLQAVHERDELNKVHRLTYNHYVDSQCTQLSTSPVETETFSLLPCKDFTFAEAYMLVPNLDKMIKGTMTPEKLKELWIR
jgi:hypothetical protein